MSRKIVYYYGNFFSEVAFLSPEGTPSAFQRINNSKLNIENSLLELINSAATPELVINIIPNSKELLRRFSKTDKMAFLTTAGFEDWLFTSRHFSASQISKDN